MKIRSELCLASLGGGAAFHRAAADKLQGNGCLKSSYFIGISQDPRMKMRETGTVVLKWWERCVGLR